MTPAQTALARRFDAAKDLERARQQVLQNQRYGFPITKPLTDAVHEAELAYDKATSLVGWMVAA